MRLVFKKYLLALMCLAFVAAACGDDNDSNNGTGGQLADAGSDATGATDADDDAESDAEDDADEWTPECAEGEDFCNGACVDITQSPDHCGACGQTCRLFAECQQGSCVCDDPDHDYCDGFCVDTNVDDINCGACGNVCDDAKVCDTGRCMTRPELVTEATNEYRESGTRCGEAGQFAPTHQLELDFELSKAAQAHAEDMAANDFMGHDGSDGSDFVERIGRTNFEGQPLGENVAANQKSAQEVVDTWVDSQGHCTNLMNPEATKIGVGYVYEEEAGSDDFKYYWVQVFAK